MRANSFLLKEDWVSLERIMTLGKYFFIMPETDFSLAESHAVTRLARPSLEITEAGTTVFAAFQPAFTAVSIFDNILKFEEFLIITNLVN